MGFGLYAVSDIVLFIAVTKGVQMAISIKVQYSRSEPTEHLFSYDLKIEVLEATDMPEEIFVFERRTSPPLQTGGDPTDKFVCIADPVDLQEFPPNAPALDDEMPYFRVTEVTLRFRSMVTLEETKDLIDEDIQLLVNSLKAAENVVPVEEKTYV
jgi:hypothetical protein